MADEKGTKFGNPLGDDTGVDPTAEVPAATLSNFDDDIMEESSISDEDMSPRTREQVVAHNVQKFVGEQMFGEATLDDLDDDPDLEEHKSKCCGLLHPRTIQSQVYDVAQMVALWYIVVMIPWQIAFELQSEYPEPLWFVDISIDLAILFDIGLNMRRYFFDPATHRLITDSKVISKEYLQSWFLLDCLSIVPFSFLVRKLTSSSRAESVASSSKLMRLARLARFARLFRLTKLANLRKFTHKVNVSLRKIGMSKPGMEFFGRIMFLAGVVLVITHVIACLWINLSRQRTLHGNDGIVRIVAKDDNIYEVYDNWYARTYLVGNAEECKGMYPDSEDKCEDNKWRTDQLYGIETADVYRTVYIDAAYWILTTMSTVGFGDILPYNTAERIFCCWVIVVGTFTWAYIVGSFSATLQAMDVDKNKYDEEMRSVKAMMRFHEVPMELADRIDSFFQYKFETHTMFDDDKVMDLLPSKIRSDFILHRFRNIINMIPFFRGCREDAVIEIVTRFKGFSVLPLEPLFEAGDPHVELCVLTKGRMAMVHTKADGEEIMEAEYFKGSFFGENQFLGFDKERTSTFRARTFCEVSTLHPDDMEPVLRKHVKLRRRLEKYAKLKSEMEKAFKEMGSKASEAAMMKMKEDIEGSWHEEGREIEDAWENIEKNEDGLVSRNLIGDLATLLGRPLKEWELDNAMHIMDADGSGFIDFDEFRSWWESNNAQLKFTGRSPQDDYNKSMKTMSEATLGLLHDVLARVEALQRDVDALKSGR